MAEGRPPPPRPVLLEPSGDPLFHLDEDLRLRRERVAAMARHAPELLGLLADREEECFAAARGASAGDLSALAGELDSLAATATAVAAAADPGFRDLDYPGCDRDGHPLPRVSVPALEEAMLAGRRFVAPLRAAVAGGVPARP